MQHKFVKEWFDFAFDDLIVAEHIQKDLYPRQVYISCYHCQQCVEKALKGVLVYFGISEPPKIHDLIRLCKLCIEKDNSFNEILRYCASINPYGVEIKYPNEIETDDAMADLILIKTKKIYEFCCSKTGIVSEYR